MKKIGVITLVISIGLLISSVFFVSANPSVLVTAIVGISNHSPIIMSVSPSSDPKLLARNKIQNYTLYFRDDEKDTVSYTITPASGYTNPISGTLTPSSYDTASGAYINFTYLSPASTPSPNPTTITVTLNDGTSLINKDIHLFIY